ncbi:MAG: acetyl-CoA carboxylase biotin carboxyl carrier protein [Gemmatimonadales bacterium]
MAKKPIKPSKSGSDLDTLKELITLLESSSVSSLRFRKGDAEYEVSRHGKPMAEVAPGPGSAALPPVEAGAHSAPSAAPPSNLIEIKSPMVGTFYRSPEPGADPYVKAGSRVAPGQTLCIIEAMKIMNEIESEVSGRVREVLVEDSQPVEFGQVLFRVEPNA